MSANALLRASNALLSAAMETPNLSALRRVVEIFGSQSALASALQISKVAVGQWFLDTDNLSHRHVPPRQCVRIERLTGGVVGRRELRPHDWQQWWPEMDGAQAIADAQIQTQAPASQALAATENVAVEVAHV